MAILVVALACLCVHRGLSSTVGGTESKHLAIDALREFQNLTSCEDVTIISRYLNADTPVVLASTKYLADIEESSKLVLQNLETFAEELRKEPIDADSVFLSSLDVRSSIDAALALASSRHSKHVAQKLAELAFVLESVIIATMSPSADDLVVVLYPVVECLVGKSYPAFDGLEGFVTRNALFLRAVEKAALDQGIEEPLAQAMPILQQTLQAHAALFVHPAVATQPTTPSGPLAATHPLAPQVVAPVTLASRFMDETFCESEAVALRYVEAFGSIDNGIREYLTEVEKSAKELETSLDQLCGDLGKKRIDYEEVAVDSLRAKASIDAALALDSSRHLEFVAQQLSELALHLEAALLRKPSSAPELVQALFTIVEFLVGKDCIAFDGQAGFVARNALFLRAVDKELDTPIAIRESLREIRDRALKTIDAHGPPGPEAVTLRSEIAVLANAQLSGNEQEFVPSVERALVIIEKGLVEGSASFRFAAENYVARVCALINLAVKTQKATHLVWAETVRPLLYSPSFNWMPSVQETLMNNLNLFMPPVAAERSDPRAPRFPLPAAPSTVEAATSEVATVNVVFGELFKYRRGGQPHPHSEGRPVKPAALVMCPHCGEEVAWGNLDNHMRTHETGPAPFDEFAKVPARRGANGCPHCDTFLLSEAALQAHVAEAHARPLNSPVQRCPSPGAHPQALNSPVQRSSSAEAQAPTIDSPVLRCPKEGCDFTFRTRRAQKDHAQMFHLS